MDIPFASSLVPAVPSSSSRSTWQDLEANRPMGVRFRLLPSMRPRRGKRSGVGGKTYGKERVEDQIEFTAAFELQLDTPVVVGGTSTSGSQVRSSSPSSSSVKVYRLLSPTLTQDVLSRSSGSQPLVNLDALLLHLGITPLYGLLKLGLSRFRGDYEVDLPVDVTQNGHTLSAQEARRVTIWHKGVWVSLATARRAVKQLADSVQGERGGEQLLKSLGQFLSWSTREAWSLDEGDEQGRMTHNWIPSPTVLHPTSTLSTDSLLSTHIKSITLLPRSNPTASTFLPSPQRTALLQDYLATESDAEQVRRDAVRTRLRRWTVQLVEAVEVWKEDWPEGELKIAQEVERSLGPLAFKATSSGSSSTDKGGGWRESTLCNLLPIFSNLSQGSWTPGAFLTVLPRNLPEELSTQLQLVEQLWIMSENLVLTDCNHRDGTFLSPLPHREPQQCEASDLATHSSYQPSSTAVTSTSSQAVAFANAGLHSGASPNEIDSLPPSFQTDEDREVNGGRAGQAQRQRAGSRQEQQRSQTEVTSLRALAAASSPSPSHDLASFRVHLFGDWLRFNIAIGHYRQQRVLGAGRYETSEKDKGNNRKESQGLLYRAFWGQSGWTFWTWCSTCLLALLALVLAMMGRSGDLLA